METHRMTDALEQVEPIFVKLTQDKGSVFIDATRVLAVSPARTSDPQYKQWARAYVALEHQVFFYVKESPEDVARLLAVA